MKKNLKLFTIGAACILSLAGLASCGGEKAIPADYDVDLTGYTEYSGKLVYSGPASQRTWIMGVADNYNRLREEQGLGTITFEYVDHGEDKVDSEITDWANGPDVYAFASDKILPLYQAGALAPVTGTYETYIKETMSEGALEAATFAGGTYAYPYAGDNGYFLYYNKSLLTETDIQTIEGIFAKAETNKMKLAYPIQSTPFYSVGTLFSFGARYELDISETGTISNVTADFDSDNGVLGGLALMKIMQEKASVWQDTQAAPTGDNGIIATVDGSWNAASYQEQMGEDYACAKLPTITVTDEKGTEHTANLSSFLGYKLYGVNPQRSTGEGERLMAAHDFAKFLTSQETQDWRFDNFSIAPTNTTVAALSKVTSNPAVKAITAQSQYAVAQTATPANLWTAPNTLTAAIANKQVNNIETLKAALKTMNDSIEAVQ